VTQPRHTLTVPWEAIQSLEWATNFVDQGVRREDLSEVAEWRRREFDWAAKQGITTPLPMHAFGVIRAAANLANGAVDSLNKPEPIGVAADYLHDQFVYGVMAYRAYVGEHDQGESEQAIQDQYNPDGLNWEGFLGYVAGFVKAMRQTPVNRRILDGYRQQPEDPTAWADNRHAAATFARLATYIRTAVNGNHFIEHPDSLVFRGGVQAAGLVRSIAVTALLADSYRLLPPDKRAVIDA